MVLEWMSSENNSVFSYKFCSFWNSYSTPLGNMKVLTAVCSQTPNNQFYVIKAEHKLTTFWIHSFLLPWERHKTFDFLIFSRGNINGVLHNILRGIIKLLEEKLDPTLTKIFWRSHKSTKWQYSIDSSVLIAGL